MWHLVTEVVATGILSVAIHSLAYDYGDKYDYMDLSIHERLLHNTMKSRYKKYDEADLDYITLMSRKVLQHVMTNPGEDNFRMLLFKLES